MTRLQSLDQLECHFTWCPEEDSTNFNIDEVIKKTEKKIQREPHKKAAHLATLSYLFTKTTLKKLNMAQSYLNEALEIDAQIRRDKQEDLKESSEFVITADLLHLKQLMRGKKPLKPSEIEPEMQRLNSLWDEPSSRARAFAMKGVTFDCFGPKKYAIGVQAFAEASRILFEHNESSNFYWLFGEAFLRARCDRQTARKHADRVQLDLWRRAREIGERRGLTTATFYANYAEAILHNNRYTDVCQELVEKSSSILLAMPKEDKEKSHVVYIVCLKVLRYLGKKAHYNSKSLRQKLFKDAEEVANVSGESGDPGFFLELSNEAKFAGDRDEAIRLLERGKALGGEPGHIWIHLKLLELRQQEWEKQMVVTEYDSLRETFQVYNRNVCTIEFHKAMYLMKLGETMEAMESCVVAVEAEPSLDQIWATDKQEFLRLLNANRAGHEEYLAWYAENIGVFSMRLDIETLYRTALQRDGNNNFALEHLGRFFMKKIQIDKAVKCFRKLSSDHEDKQKLLAESLLRDPQRNLKTLLECLECGCLDAAPRILDILVHGKSTQNTAQKVMAEVSSQRDSQTEPVFFRTQLYELCAKIELVLEDSSSFSLESSETESVAVLTESVKSRIAEFLELSRLTSKSASTDRTSDDRGNLMRSSRLRMTKLHLSVSDGETQEKSDLIVTLLKESKEVLDRSLAVRLTGKGREFSYPHAFGQIKKQLGPEFKEVFNKLTSESDRKTFELESLMKLLKDNKGIVSIEKINKYLFEETKNKDKNFHQARDTRDLFSFMVNREHRILSHEDSWIVRWIYLVNSEKHSDVILVKELNEQLRSDWSGDGECRRTAYDVAHLAAEFAEETWVVFSPSGVVAGAGGTAGAGAGVGVAAGAGTPISDEACAEPGVQSKLHRLSLID